VGLCDRERNLRYARVNQPEKGRTCRACHETHASNKAKHVPRLGAVRFQALAAADQLRADRDGRPVQPGLPSSVGLRPRETGVINHPAQGPATRLKASTAPGDEGKDEKKGSQP